MSQVRVRMYRTGGIGDCFLLSFQDGQGPHMLIDCGILRGTPEGAENLKKAIRNVAEVTNGRLDVLVVTHEHWDHVSGLFQAQEEFQQRLTKIGEVWLAWTEDPHNEKASRLREQKEKARQAVTAAGQKLRGLMMGMDPGSKKEEIQNSLEALEQMSLFYAPQDAASLGLASETSVGYSPADAMEWARKNTGGRVRYLDPQMEAIPLPGCENARIFVLGPPLDETLLKKENPTKSAPEVYTLAAGIDEGFLAAVGIQGGNQAAHPFHPSFEIKPEQAQQDSYFQHTYYAKEEEWRTIEVDWMWNAQRLALQLDADTNNTSLALAIELPGPDRKVLIFPGDAQVGNWLSWQGRSWKGRNERGELEEVKVEDLLKRTVLYKVGHHASHNATTRWGLELMQGEGFTALIPVYEEQAHEQGKSGWNMPFPSLLKRLQEKTEGRVFRADHGEPEQMQTAGKYEVLDDWIDLWF